MDEREKNAIMIKRTLARLRRYRQLLKEPEKYGVEGPRAGLRHDQKHLLYLRIQRQTGVYPAEN